MTDTSRPTTAAAATEPGSAVADRMAAAKALPPAWYTDPDHHRREIDRVFGRSWVAVGLTTELTPGRLLVRPVGSRSVLIAVDERGQPHAHLNACRHRGTELAAADCEIGATIRCPYHRWGYRLDGTLVSTPRFDHATHPGFDPADHGLIPVRVETWGCLVFACLDPDTPPLDRWLGDLPQRLAGYRLDTWTHRETRVLPVAANWKLISENFQEYYHLPWVHPSLAPVSRVEDHYRFQGPGMYCGQTTTPVSGSDSGWQRLPDLPGLDPSDAVSGRHIALFPNVVMSILPNHVFVMRLTPDGPGRTIETCTWLVPPHGDTNGSHGSGADDNEVGNEAFAATREFWLEVNGEDIDLVERSQRGLEGGAVPPGPLVARFEEPLHRFHSMVRRLLADEPLVGLVVPPGDGPDADEALGGRPNPNPATIDAHGLGRPSAALPN